MNTKALILYSLPIMLLGVLVGGFLAQRLLHIKGTYQKASVGIALGCILATVNFFAMRQYTANLEFLGYDPRLIVCTFISGGIMWLNLDILINSRFRTRKR